MAGAILKPAGDQTVGVQPVGIVQQYQLASTASNVDTSTDILPADGSSDGASGASILGTVPPGKTGLRQVVPAIQRAAVLLSDSTAGAVGNALVPTFSSANTDPVAPTGSLDTDGLSQAPQHE